MLRKADYSEGSLLENISGRGVTANMSALGADDSGFESRRSDLDLCRSVQIGFLFFDFNLEFKDVALQRRIHLGVIDRLI